MYNITGVELLKYEMDCFAAASYEVFFGLTISQCRDE